MNCRFCGAELTHVFINLGHQPPSNSFLTNLNEPETTYPLRVFVCDQCWLVQLPEYKKATEIFKDDYVYFSSQSPANVSHAKEFADIMVERFGLWTESDVLEIGSNDGYMLQWFKEKSIPCVGFEPSRDVADVANKKGIPTYYCFFGADDLTRPFLSHIGDTRRFNLICGINVLAHQPDINDFVEGVRIALAPKGVAVFEFPYLVNLIDKCQFDTIYHEHYSYYSLMSISTIFRKHGLEIFDVDEIPEHGGSLRIYAYHGERSYVFDSVKSMIANEEKLGVDSLDYYTGFQDKVSKIKTDIVSFLIDRTQWGKTIVGYGAAAKGNTFLNYCSIRSDLVSFVVDRSPYKQGKYLPGSHIRVTNEDELKAFKPDYVLVLSWNIFDEVVEQLSYIREWGGKFIRAIDKLEVI